MPESKDKDQEKEQVRKATGIGCLTVVIIAVIFAIVTSLGGGTKCPKIDYEVYKDVTDEAPAYAKVTRLIVLKTTEVSEKDLEKLLKCQFDKVKKEVSFSQHDSPTVVTIYIFPSEAHLKSCAGQQIAMLSWSQAMSEPTISIRKDRLAYLKEEDETKYGLTTKERKKIFFEIEQMFRENEKKVPQNPVESLEKGKSYKVLQPVPVLRQKYSNERLSEVSPQEVPSRLFYAPAGSRLVIRGKERVNGVLFYSVYVKEGNTSIKGWVKASDLLYKIDALTSDKILEYSQRVKEALDELNKESEKEIAKKYGLSVEEIDSIINEGLEKNWPLPPEEGCWEGS